MKWWTGIIRLHENVCQIWVIGAYIGRYLLPADDGSSISLAGSARLYSWKQYTDKFLTSLNVVGLIWDYCK